MWKKNEREKIKTKGKGKEKINEVAGHKLGHCILKMISTDIRNRA